MLQYDRGWIGQGSEVGPSASRGAAAGGRNCPVPNARNGEVPLYVHSLHVYELRCIGKAELKEAV